MKLVELTQAPMGESKITINVDTIESFRECPYNPVHSDKPCDPVVWGTEIITASGDTWIVTEDYKVVKSMLTSFTQTWSKHLIPVVD